MFSRIKIKYKIIILFLLLAFLLIIAGTLYFYISGNKYIEDQTAAKLYFYSNLYEDRALESTTNLILEINGLNSHLDIIKNNSKEFNKNIIFNELDKFASINKEKYQSIIYKDDNFNHAFEVEPLKVFGGEYSIRNIEQSNDTLLNSVLNLTQINNGLIGSRINLRSKNIFITNKISSKQNYIIAKLLFNQFFSSIESAINAPTDLKIFVIDSSGYIVYSQESVFLKKKIETVLSTNNNVNTSSDIVYLDNNTAYHCSSLNMLGITIVFTYNYKSIINDFNSFISRGLLLSILLFISILIVVYFMANKISGTVEEISSIAGNVAAGDFSKKIDIEREDELGFLINSFNNMVDRLNKSYNDLHILNRELRDKIDEITRTKEELSKSQKLALIGETVSKISHEIQNKISGVSIWVQNLEVKLEKDDTTTFYLDEMKLALQNFMNMLVDFKKFYRKPIINPSKFVLSELLSTTVNKLENDISDKQIEIRTNIEEMTQTIVADQILLEECLINLIINAIHHSPDEGKIDLEINKAKDTVLISISDQGCGVSDENVPHIFEPFFTTKQSGSGLGLAIVQNIVNAHLGRVYYKNIKPKGARFIVELPIYQE